MAERDLLHKLLRQATPDAPDAEARALRPASPGKLGVRTPAREVGREQEQRPADGKAPAQGAGGKAGTQGRAAPTAPPAEAPAPKAFQAAYFNRDVQATAAPNLRSKPMGALRGEQAATDLKKIVLPPPAHGDGQVAPESLERAMAGMQPNGELSDGLASLVGRQSAWTSLPTVQQAHIEARERLLQSMVEARKAALARVQQSPTAAAQSATLVRALAATSSPLKGDEAADEVEAQADGLIGETQTRATGMRARIAKVLGVKQ